MISSQFFSKKKNCWFHHFSHPWNFPTYFPQQFSSILIMKEALHIITPWVFYFALQKRKDKFYNFRYPMEANFFKLLQLRPTIFSPKNSIVLFVAHWNEDKRLESIWSFCSFSKKTWSSVWSKNWLSIAVWNVQRAL